MFKARNIWLPTILKIFMMWYEISWSKPNAILLLNQMNFQNCVHTAGLLQALEMYTSQGMEENTSWKKSAPTAHQKVATFGPWSKELVQIVHEIQFLSKPELPLNCNWILPEPINSSESHIMGIIFFFLINQWKTIIK